jgi:LPS sulfotransferase NodH
MAHPRTGVLLCALPRTGSSLLGELLHSTGVVGYAGEWFLYPERARLWREWGVRSHDDYLERVLDQGTSPNGVFAAKVMWGHMGEFLVYARRASGDFESSDLAVIEALVPQPSFVWVRRRDTVAQAVSWAKAAQTDEWRSGTGEARDPVYDFGQIDWLVHQLRVWDGAWERWFEAQGIEPEVVWYEDLEVRPTEAVERLLRYLGLETPAGAEIKPSAGLVKQANGMNAHWIARYLTDSKMSRR